MTVFDGEKYLAEAINSILAQTFTDFELLIVDDGSQDTSAEIIRSYKQRDSRICFFQLERNVGLALARNHCIASATGEYITFMDCDDVSLPERLQKQVDFMQSNPNIGGLGTCARTVSEDLKTTIADFNVPQQHAHIALNMFVGASFVGATVMLRQQFLTTGDGFEPGRRSGVDTELFCRLLCETQIKFANLPENLLLYRRHEQAISFDQNKRREADCRVQMFERLWDEAPERTIDRFYRLRIGQKLSWADRRAAKRDLLWLIDSMIARNWVEPEDKHLILHEMNRRLEQASPRLWQQFSHWRRKHFQSWLRRWRCFAMKRSP